MNRIVLAMTLGVLICPSANADFDAGMAAYRTHEFTLAFEEFYQEAVTGHETAQFNLGVLYYRGEGAERNIVKAFSWIELSTQHGDEQNIQAQEMLILNMSSLQVQSGLAIAEDLANQHGLKFSPPEHSGLDSRIVVTDIR